LGVQKTWGALPPNAPLWLWSWVTINVRDYAFIILCLHFMSGVDCLEPHKRVLRKEFCEIRWKTNNVVAFGGCLHYKPLTLVLDKHSFNWLDILKIRLIGWTCRTYWCVLSQLCQTGKSLQQNDKALVRVTKIFSTSTMQWRCL